MYGRDINDCTQYQILYYNNIIYDINRVLYRSIGASSSGARKADG